MFYAKGTNVAQPCVGSNDYTHSTYLILSYVILHILCSIYILYHNIYNLHDIHDMIYMIYI